MHCRPSKIEQRWHNALFESQSASGLEPEQSCSLLIPKTSPWFYPRFAKSSCLKFACEEIGALIQRYILSNKVWIPVRNGKFFLNLISHPEPLVLHLFRGPESVLHLYPGCDYDNVINTAPTLWTILWDCRLRKRSILCEVKYHAKQIVELMLTKWDLLRNW